jgi:hypothetical protein
VRRGSTHKTARNKFKQKKKTKEMGELLAGVSQSSLLAVRRRVGFGLHRNQSNSTSIICCSIRRLPKLRSSRGFGDRSDQRQQFLLAVAASGAISSDPLQASTTVTVDSIQPDTVSGGGGGDNNNNNDKGEGGSDENNKKMSGMSMSQKLTLAYAALVGGKGTLINFTFTI